MLRDAGQSAKAQLAVILKIEREMEATGMPVPG